MLKSGKLCTNFIDTNVSELSAKCRKVEQHRAEQEKQHKNNQRSIGIIQCACHFIRNFQRVAAQNCFLNRGKQRHHNNCNKKDPDIQNCTQQRGQRKDNHTRYHCHREHNQQ